jgi:hypothetical protein
MCPILPHTLRSPRHNPRPRQKRLQPPSQSPPLLRQLLVPLFRRGLGVSFNAMTIRRRIRCIHSAISVKFIPNSVKILPPWAEAKDKILARCMHA